MIGWRGQCLLIVESCRYLQLDDTFFVVKFAVDTERRFLMVFAWKYYFSHICLREWINVSISRLIYGIADTNKQSQTVEESLTPLSRLLKIKMDRIGQPKAS